MTSIEVQVGTPGQRKAIEEELRTIVSPLGYLSPPVTLQSVVVAADFDAVVNSLAGTQTYRSVRPAGSRNLVALAKVIRGPTGNHLVISPGLYTESHDQQSRCFTCVHELQHFINEQKLPPDPQPGTASAEYLSNLRTFLDEYIADRRAYSFVVGLFGTMSTHWSSTLRLEFENFSSLICDSEYRLAIDTAVIALDAHRDVLRFLQEVRPLFDAMALAILHSYSLHDAFPTKFPIDRLAGTPFVNDRTQGLLDYIRRKHSDGTFELADGIPVVKSFMLNFGLSLSDTPDGLMCSTHTI